MLKIGKKTLALMTASSFAFAHDSGVPHDEACGFVVKSLSTGYFLAFGFLVAISFFGFWRFWQEKQKKKTVWSWLVLALGALLSAAIQYYALPCA